ncbi:SRPBCC family protein [Ferruginibacter profundus]
MRPVISITIATVYALTIRLLFGFFGEITGIMSIGLLILSPFVVGYLTIILLPKGKASSQSAAFFLPWLTSLVILVVTISLDIEGSICWIMIFPIFAIFAGLGGLIAYGRRKRKSDIEDLENYDDWTKPDTLKISVLILFPFVFGIVEGDRSLSKKEMVITKSVVIKASPAAVWKALGSINEIAAAERHTSFSVMLGFPSHLRTTLDTLAVGGTRMAYYEKGLYFTETIRKCEPEKLLVLDIKTDPLKIPPTVMDEHIVIGGKHVDILQDVYTLEQLPDGSSRLSLSSRFFINTPFNWYAGIWADYLMSDILHEELNLIKARAAKL